MKNYQIYEITTAEVEQRNIEVDAYSTK